MIRTPSLVVALFAFAACGPGRQAAWEKQPTEQQTQTPAAGGDLAAEAKAAWEKRDDRAQLEKAIAAWEQVLAAKPDDAAALTSIARAYYFLGDGYMRLAGEDEAMLATFEKGISAGERAMMAASPDFAARVKNGEKVEDAVKSIAKEAQPAVYWYASNLGKFAVAKGFTTTLFYKDRIYAVMQRVLELDETFYHAAPHRYFGGFYAKAPAFAGGDLNKSKEHFERALALDDKFLGTKVLFAEFYATRAENRDLFTKLLTDVTNADPAVLPDVVPEQKMEQTKAKALLAQINDIF
jgi:hypothetical protein